jgi:hypothetical protein
LKSNSEFVSISYVISTSSPSGKTAEEDLEESDC